MNQAFCVITDQPFPANALGSTSTSRLTPPAVEVMNLFTDPEARLFWPYLLGALVLPLVVLGWHRGISALRTGLFSTTIWYHPSSRADIVMLFVRLAMAACFRVPWFAASMSCALWLGLLLAQLAPLPALTWSRQLIAAVYTIVLFVSWDASRFVVHRLMHRVPTLWAFHRVHHTAEVLTPLTLYRTHPVENLIYDARGFLVSTTVAGVFLYLFRGSAMQFELFGINAIGALCNLAGANLRHSQVWLRFGVFERILLSPAQHQMHHSSAVDEQMNNFGTYLALWDRLFKTWRPAPEEPVREFGLQNQLENSHRLVSLLVSPIAVAARVFNQNRIDIGSNF
jgi:sterol desaturase/sphingolipid hydroxylase (fatty acid hydroxylase superfamily)